jgi:hypothetical protein
VQARIDDELARRNGIGRGRHREDWQVGDEFAVRVDGVWAGRCNHPDRRLAIRRIQRLERDL